MQQINYLRSILAMTASLLLASGSVCARDLPAIQNPLLWKINTSPPSWLFGTIHLPDERVTTLPAEVQSAFDQSKAFYAEVPMDSRMLLRATLGTLRNDQKTLKDVLPRKTLSRLQLRLKKINPTLSAGAFIGMKTWDVTTSLALLENKSKHPQSISLDLVLYQSAQMAGKRVGGLESVEQQLGYLDQFSEQEQIEMLDNRLQQMDKAEKEHTTISEIMIQWYLKGDVENIHHIIEFPMPQNQALQQRAVKSLITNRNKTMAKSIAEILRLHPGESHFFALGAAHLGGGNSVQNHLRKLGFTTERVTAQ
ncbi:MAG TPA: hypothetical protein DDW45_01890 [Gammaproteobacteria bacterium]|nr:hypothetical protein [Gammaproteobacteria bacterium]